MSKINEEQMKQFINENMCYLPETTKVSLDKYDVTTQYRKVRYYKNLAEKKNNVAVEVNPVDYVMNVIKEHPMSSAEYDDLINRIDVYREELKAKQITDLEEQIKNLQGQLKQLKK